MKINISNITIIIILVNSFILFSCKKEKVIYKYERQELNTPIEFIVFNKSSKQIDKFHCIIVINGVCNYGMGVNFEVYKGEFEIGKKYNFQIPLTRTIINKDGRHNTGCPENPINYIAFSTDSTIKNQIISGVSHPSWYYDQINPDAYRAKVNVSALIKAGTNNYFVAEFKD